MICISIAQESRRLAMADMLNAAAMGADLLEVRLDCFERDPDPKELLSARRKPVIFSCRRPTDGGNWKGTEEERIKLLKTAIINNADYCELELDIADQVRRFGSCQRVISYTNLKETPADIAEIYEEARKKDPDIIKLTCRARTPEEAWPLVQLLVKRPVLTVVVGLGRPGLMLAILGRKIGAPHSFTLAALERGMEAYPGQPTVSELERVYHYRAIGRGTKLLGVTGVSERSFLTTALLNAALAHLDLPIRCLPLQVGNVKLFRKIIDGVKLVGVVVEEEQQDALRQVATELDAGAAGAKLTDDGVAVEHAIDLLVPGEAKKWLGAHTFSAAAIPLLEAALREKERKLDGAIVLIAGLTPATRSLARAIKERGGKLIFASRNGDESAKWCRMFGGRHVPFDGIYTALHDVVIVSREDEERVVVPSYLRSGMIVMDLTDLPHETSLTREARLRGCAVVSPQALLVEQVRLQVKRLTDQDVPPMVLVDALAGLVEDE